MKRKGRGSAGLDEFMLPLRSEVVRVCLPREGRVAFESELFFPPLMKWIWILPLIIGV